MKVDLHGRHPRSQTVLLFTRQAIKDRQLVVANFAPLVADSYLLAHELHERRVKFREPIGDTASILATFEHNVQIVDRYIKEVVKAFPADLEEAWVENLPQPYRDECKLELVKRYGFLGAVAPEPDQSGHASLGDCMQEFGEFVSVVGQQMADGTVDTAEFKRFLKESDDVIASLVSFRQAITQRLSDGDTHA